MKSPDLALPDYLPTTVITGLQWLLKPAEITPARQLYEKDMLKSFPERFVESVLASGLKIGPATVISHLIYDNTRMKDAWSFLSSLNSESTKKHEIYESDSWLFLRSAVNTFLLFDQVTNTDSDSKKELNQLYKILSQAKEIVSRHTMTVDSERAGCHGHLNKEVFEACISKPDLWKPVGDMNEKHSGNELNTVQFLELLCKNIRYYQSFRQQALVTADDFTAITREKSGKQGVLRAYIGYLRNGGLNVERGKLVTVIIPSIVSVLLTILGMPSDDVSEDEVRKAVRMVIRAEDKFYDSYDHLIDRLPPLEHDDTYYTSHTFQEDWMA